LKKKNDNFYKKIIFIIFVIFINKIIYYINKLNLLFKKWINIKIIIKYKLIIKNKINKLIIKKKYILQFIIYLLYFK
jgi:hypothetical protein